MNSYSSTANGLEVTSFCNVNLFSYNCKAILIRVNAKVMKNYLTVFHCCYYLLVLKKKKKQSI